MKRGHLILIGALLILNGCKQPPAMEHHEEHMHDPNQIYLTVRQQQLAGVITDTVQSGEINEMKSLVGIVAVNESKRTYVTSRLKGRIEKLFVRNVNDYVDAGAPLLTIYSEELLSDEQDYLSAFQDVTATGKLIADAAKNRLKLWGLSDQEIQLLEITKTPHAVKTVFSNKSGTVTRLFVSEGDYMETGSQVMELTDVSTLWVEVQVYADEVQNVYKGATAEISFPDLPLVKINATPEFVNPTFEQNSRITLVRYAVQNSDGLIRPGMRADVQLQLSTKSGVVIPTSALIMEKEAIVWVDLGDGVFEKRMVTIGIRNETEVEIISGIMEGEKVLIAGAYLVNSEFILRNGANAMGGMVM